MTNFLQKSKIIFHCKQVDILFAAIVFVLLILCIHLWQKLLLFTGLLWFRKNSHETVAVLVLLLFCSILLSFGKVYVLSNGSIFRVTDIKNGYIIADNGEYDVIVYGIENVSFDDVIYIKGDYEQIHSVRNMNQFCFDDYMARRGVCISLNAKDYYVFSKGCSIRSILYRYVMSMPSETRNLCLSLYFGIQREEGTYFIQSSGLHVSALAYALKKRLMRRRSEHQAQFFITVFSIFFGICFGFSDSLFRISCFHICSFLFEKKNVRLGASMVIVILLRPYLAGEMTFVLPVCIRLFHYFSSATNRGRFFSLPMLAFLQLCYFHEIAWIQTLFFQPLRKFYAVLFVFSIFLFVFPGWNEVLLTVAQILEMSVEWMQKITFHYAPSLLWIACWLFFLSMWMRSSSIRCSCLFAFALLFARVEPYFDPFFEVMIMDVGQGDCALISLPHHQGTIMIDVAGSLYKDIPKDIILPVLKDKQIQTIDLVVITHDDFDHSGGLESLEQWVRVKKVLTMKKDYNGKLNLYALLQDYKGIDKNENSIVSWFGRDNLSYLFMGDCGNEGEKQLLQDYDDLPCDFLKLGHHGSNSGSSMEFLHQMKPRYALISAGFDNRYGHPAKEVLLRLQQERIPYFCTAEDGAIVIRSVSVFKYLRTAQNDFVIINDR